ncbi:hypothetical protein GOBAR_AA34962 [Gossypium barbadense]|uniref:Lecithin-cholesterol acyltransferase-like 4 n=1 Tax=Gossypium barbadense TaxID=3634 RepID=A0A2P5W3N2_GOSBA|nr:hypothetical protein GOBAR_AA34962 [Gossypium barbadense]
MDILQSVEIWLKLIKKPQPYVDPNLDPVLLVPGIAGSILTAVDDQNGKEERVWVRILGANYKFRTKLWSRFDPSTGRTESLDPNTTIKVPGGRYGLGAIDVLDPDMIVGRDCVCYFHDMIVEMLKWGFQEGKTLFGFGYDFRQSNRLQETMDRLAEKLELVYEASGGKKINVISHSMGGLLVKCFMGLHSDIFQKYVKNWIAIAAPFRGKWSFLIECPSIYELMACPHFHWQHIPLLEIWMEKEGCDGYPRTILESYRPGNCIDIFKEALSGNTVDYNGEMIPLPFNLEILKWVKETQKVLSHAKVPSGVKFYNIYGINLETPHSVCYGSEETPVTNIQDLRFFQPKYICVDGDGTVPAESAKADGLHAEARVAVPGEHRGILCEPHVFRILKHWLRAGEPDPFYNPINDYVILPTAFEMESHHEKGLQVTSLKEEWEIVTKDQDDLDDTVSSRKPLVSSISVSQGGSNKHSLRSEAHATVIVHPQNEGKQHVELNAISVSVDA